MPEIFWLAGENSGDLHAAQVMKELNTLGNDLQHSGIGGKRMQSAGLKPLFPFTRFSIMGFIEVLKHLLFFFQVEKKIKGLFINNPPDLVVLVDYPGLNLRIARLAKKRNIPVLYYICPQFWAWKMNRIKKLKKYTDHIAYILPFEKHFMEINAIPSTYVGHPIAEEISITMDRNSFANKYDLDPARIWLGFLPGSRDTEIIRILPEFLKAILHLDPTQNEFLISLAPTVNEALFHKIMGSFPRINLKVIRDDAYHLMHHCRLLVVTSGTATLETAYIGTPFIIVYRGGRLSYEIGKRLVKINMIGLPNLIMGKKILPELVQYDASGNKIYSLMMELMVDNERYDQIKKELKQLHAILDSRSASRETAEIIRNMLYG
ncbi:MAG: lipid-A-disaccharide synthase [Candidatus Cloacimonetes bacterium]|nr:lipid-A-disaccharide synthase [Candidatus Cloacimonadota bacterium]